MSNNTADVCKPGTKEAVILDMLSITQDTLIVDLYSAAYGGRPAPIMREQQQIVGKRISQINTKLRERDLAIRPGEARYSYRIYRLSSR